MLASERVMHRTFAQVIANYHPFAEYLGYQEAEDGFIVYYDGGNGQQGMLVDVEGNIIADTTVGTTRTMGLLGLGAAIISGLMGDY
ncbi:MAG: hypothetical protein F6K35_24570 [Okeania sp. SIO2H7]|nr:hypothetical protein [Okeania sp. SIO2H7]